MSAVGQRPTETYQDLPIINSVILRLTVAGLKAVIKKITESSVPSHMSIQGNKKPLQERLTAHFRQLKEGNMADHYRESRRILEAEFGSAIQYNPQAARTFSYTPATGLPAASINRTATNYSNYQAQYQLQQQHMHDPRQRAFANSTPGHPMHHGSSGVASSSLMASNSFLPSIRPHFKASPFLEVRDWVGPATICPEAPNNQQRSSTMLKLQLTPSNLELLKRPTAVHQLRLFCTTKTYYDAAANANHPAPVEFPLSCEVKVNQITLSVNLKGKKTAAKVLAPHLNKDHALYFGGQENKVELIYMGTSQKYVLSVAICEIRNADTLARRIKRERVRSKVEVLKAMKVAAADDDIEMGDVSMGLKCPLGAMRMTAPIRSTVCVHMQCFDALSFLSLNEQTPSWQCPICDKMINPDTLFLDGYVLDILERVPDEEETVLVDAQGKWHTPNKKFSSEADEQPQTPPRIDSNPAPVSKKEETDELIPAFPFVSPPPPGNDSQNKKAVEVFEIDDDDSPLPNKRNWEQEQARMQAQTQAQMELLKRNQAAAAAAEKARETSQTLDRAMEKASPLPGVQRLPSNSVMANHENGNGRQQSSSREPSQSRVSNIGPIINGRPSVVALKESPALPSPGLPSATDAAPKPVVDVIDLTFSDSDDDGPMPPPRRRQSSTVTRQVPTNATGSSSAARPPSLPAIRQESVPRGPSESATTNGVQRARRDSSASNGSSDLPLHTRASNGTTSNGAHNPAPPRARQSSAQKTTSQAPRRRLISPDEDGDEDEDDSQPIIRKRKRIRTRDRNYVGSEEGDSSSVERSSGSSSDRLYEEERAGLAVR